ncbi:MAG: substrate-binding domain-containing protein [Chloroflexi bacterium]|nr:substrate-binding domain-containing protein [Chloroflexota bacterium]
MFKHTPTGKLLGGILLAAVLLAACSPASTVTPTTALDVPTSAPTAALPAAPAVASPTAAPTTVLTTAVVATSTDAPTPPPHPAGTLLLGTTTSVRDTGLLDYLLPIYTKQTGVPVSYVAVGTGQALQLGRDGNVDGLLVHSRTQELQFMADGDGIRREDLMYNDFVIVGPVSDPAKVSSAKTALEAFQAIANAQTTFISRGDKSGTNTKELAIWKAANITPQGDWYVNAGQGMGAVLIMADEKNAYTLSDRATYLTQSKKGSQLKILMQGDPLLLNFFGIIAVNPDKNPKIQNALANQFIDWIISVPAMQEISDFQKDVFGASLFFPISKPWMTAHPETVNPLAEPAATATP